MEFSDRIQLIKAELRNKGWKYADLADSSGIPLSTILKVLSGNTRSPRIDTVEAIERALGLDNKQPLPSLFSRFDNISPIATQRVPMLGEIACGEPIFANEDRESYVQSGREVNADFCLTARGDSMVGARILDGDIVFCRSQEMVDNGEVAAVIIGDEATLKRVYYYPEKKKLVLQAENPKYEPFVFIGEELDEIRIIGKAIAFQSDVR